MSRVERFSQRARKILSFAQEEAQTAGNTTIETPHVLLGMLRVPDSVACRVLTDLRITYEKVLPVVRAANPAEDMEGATTPNLGDDTKRLLESAVEVARNRGDHHVGSEHMLLALVKGDDKSIRYLIRQINLEPSVVRSCVERVLLEGGDGLPSTEPLTLEEPVAEQQEAPQMSNAPEPNVRSRVLKMVETGKITPQEAAELLKAMRMSALPMPGSSGFILLPLDEINFDALRQRNVHFVVTDKGSNTVTGEVVLPFEQAQTELYRLLRDIYAGEHGALIEVDGEEHHLQIRFE